MTLTEVNFYVRKFAPVAVIAVLVIIILVFAFQLLSLYYKQRTPAPVVVAPVVTDTKFNQIKVPIIPESKPSDTFTYIIDTIDGTTNIENATSAANVYFIPNKSPSFGYLSQIAFMAKSVEINPEVTQYKKTDNIVRYDDGKHKLDIDITNYNFSYEHRLSPDGEIKFDPTNPPAESTLKSNASTFLSKMNRYPLELTQGEQHLIFMNINMETRQVSTLQTPEGANMVEVDFYRPNQNGYPVATSSYYNSPHYVILALDRGNTQIVRAQVKLYEYSQEQVGVYPLKTSEEAWKDLSAGKGYVVSANKTSGDVRVKKIFLAYYDPDVYQEYFQPIYVFLGEDKFAAYVPAVREDLLIRSQ